MDPLAEFAFKMNPKLHRRRANTSTDVGFDWTSPALCAMWS